MSSSTPPHHTPAPTQHTQPHPGLADSLPLSIHLSLALTRARALSLLHDTLDQPIFFKERARSLSLSPSHTRTSLSLSHTRVSLSLIHASLSLAYTHTHLHDTLNQTISSKHDISVSPVSTREDTVSREMPTPFDISTLCSSEHLRTTLFGFPAASA